MNHRKNHNAHTPGYVLSHERATVPVIDDLLVVVDLHEYLFGGRDTNAIRSIPRGICKSLHSRTRRQDGSIALYR